MWLKRRRTPRRMGAEGESPKETARRAGQRVRNALVGEPQGPESEGPRPQPHVRDGLPGSGEGSEAPRVAGARTAGDGCDEDDPFILGLTFRVPAGQSPRKLDRVIRGFLTEIEDLLDEDFAPGDLPSAYGQRHPELLPLRGGHGLHMRSVPDPKTAPSGPVAFAIERRCGAPPDPAHGLLVARRRNVFRSAVRPVRETLSGGQVVYAGNADLDLTVGPGGDVDLGDLSGKLAWNPSRGWTWWPGPEKGDRFESPFSGTSGPSGQVCRQEDDVVFLDPDGSVAARAVRFRRPVSAKRARLLAGPVPSVGLYFRGRVLREPFPMGSVATFHEYAGVPMPDGVVNAIDLGDVWLGITEKRGVVGHWPASRKTEVVKGAVGIPSWSWEGEVEFSVAVVDLPPKCMAAFLMSGGHRVRIGRATRQQPLVLGRGGAGGTSLVGDDPFFCGSTRFSAAASGTDGHGRVAVRAGTRSEARAWYRDRGGQGRTGAWKPIGAQGVRVAPGADIVVGSTWYEIDRE